MQRQWSSAQTTDGAPDAYTSNNSYIPPNQQQGRKYSNYSEDSNIHSNKQLLGSPKEENSHPRLSSSAAAAAVAANAIRAISPRDAAIGNQGANYDHLDSLKRPGLYRHHYDSQYDDYEFDDADDHIYDAPSQGVQMIHENRLLYSKNGNALSPTPISPAEGTFYYAPPQAAASEKTILTINNIYSTEYSPLPIEYPPHLATPTPMQSKNGSTSTQESIAESGLRLGVVLPPPPSYPPPFTAVADMHQGRYYNGPNEHQPPPLLSQQRPLASIQAPSTSSTTTLVAALPAPHQPLPFNNYSDIDSIQPKPLYLQQTFQPDSLPTALRNAVHPGRSSMFPTYNTNPKQPAMENGSQYYDTQAMNEKQGFYSNGAPGGVPPYQSSPPQIANQEGYNPYLPNDNQGGYVQTRNNSQGYDQFNHKPYGIPHHNELDIDEDLSSPKSKKSKYRLSAGCWIIIAVVGTILLLIGILLGVYWPRPLLFSVASTVSIPNFSTQTPSIQGGGTMFNTTFNMTININNPNLFDLNLERIDITSELLVSGSQVNGKAFFKNSPPLNIDQYSTPLGTGSRGYLVTRSKAETTAIVFHQLNIYTQPASSTDPAVYELIDACGLAGSTARPMKATYKAVLNPGWLRQLGYRPQATGTFLFTCSPSLAEAVKTTYNL
ncbi:hypothetical protein MT418_007701 [Batrachochytrium dendrobatidis]